MKKYSVETSVGLFCVLGLLCVAYLTVKLGKMELLGGDYYRITASFTSAQGLGPGGFVQLAGVQIGQVEAITLDSATYRAQVRMKIRKGVALDQDSIASIKTSGLIGDKYVNIEPGGSDRPLQDGQTLVETESAVDLEALISKYVFGAVNAPKKDDKKE